MNQASHEEIASLAAEMAVSDFRRDGGELDPSVTDMVVDISKRAAHHALKHEVTIVMVQVLPEHEKAVRTLVRNLLNPTPEAIK